MPWNAGLYFYRESGSGSCCAVSAAGRRAQGSAGERRGPPPRAEGHPQGPALRASPGVEVAATGAEVADGHPPHLSVAVVAAVIVEIFMEKGHLVGDGELPLLPCIVPHPALRPRPAEASALEVVHYASVYYAAG